MMVEAPKYSAMESLPAGRTIKIRALKPEDRPDLAAAVGRLSAESLYRRFFAPKRYFSEKEIDFFLNIDFAKHVALVAVIEEADHHVIAAGGRYVVQRPGVAEVAFAVIDDYQGQGIGSTLLRHLAKIARDAGLREFTAEVLPDNIPMLKVFEKSGLKVTSKRDVDATHVVLQLG